MNGPSAEKDAVRFERIGRNHYVPDMPIAGDVADLDNVAEQVWEHARGHLGSRFFDVAVLDDGRVLIEGGRFGCGQVTRVVPPEGGRS